MSFLGVNSALKRKSASYEKAENDIARLAYMQLGLNTEDYKSVKYPTSFDVVALMEEVESMFKIMGKNFSVTLNKEMQKDIARRSLPHATEENRKIIEDEIDAGDGYVEPEANSGIQPEKDGQGNINTDQGKSFKTRDQKEREDANKRLDEE